jgi:hypothetical protein
MHHLLTCGDEHRLAKPVWVAGMGLLGTGTGGNLATREKPVLMAQVLTGFTPNGMGKLISLWDKVNYTFMLVLYNVHLILTVHAHIPDSQCTNLSNLYQDLIQEPE